MPGVADVVVEALKAHGVSIIFGVPGGGTNLELVEAARQVNIPFVLAHTETAAVFMAATYGEMTGRPGVALCTLGPGVTSSVNGVAHAYLDRAPVLLISDRYPDADLGVVTHQAVDHAAVVRPMTKWTATLRPPVARAVVERAIRQACAEPAGPVHLDFPPEGSSEDTELGPREENDGPTRSGALGVPSQEALDKARAMLRSARKPLVVAGLQVRREAAEVGRILNVLLSSAGMPAFTTYKAKGVVSERHPWWAGIFTNAIAEAALVEQADLITLAGVDPVELIPRPWTYHAPIIWIGRTPNRFGYFPADVELVGELGYSLGRLSEALGEGWKSVWDQGAVADHRASLVSRLRSSGKGLQPSQVIEVARELAPADAIATVDSGAHMFLATELWAAIQPGKFFISSGLATMGYALPAAIAASLVVPDVPVVCFTGDGGLFMQLAELETAARLRSRIVVVVMDDGGFSLIRLKQMRKGYAPIGVAFGPSRFVRVGEAFGVSGDAVSTLVELEDALRRALRQDGPALITAQIDGSAYEDIFTVIRG